MEKINLCNFNYGNCYMQFEVWLPTCHVIPLFCVSQLCIIKERRQERGKKGEKRSIFQQRFQFASSMRGLM